MLETLRRQLIGITASILLLSVLIYVAMFLHAGRLTAQAPDSAAGAVVEPVAPAAISQVLSYQGRLLDPATGQPKPDGNYTIAFSLYNAATGGSPLWTETEPVSVTNGFFSALLGDTTMLISNNFNGQELYLGVTLAGDPEMTPRQRLAHTAYAMFAENAGKLDGIDSTGFAAASHNHSGAAINSGTVAEARIDAALTRDNEVMGIVKGADGADSGLDADLLDGQSSAAFAAASHTHDGAAITAGTVAEARIAPALARDNEVMGIVLAADGADSGLDADLLDGQSSAAFAAASHTHDGAAITSGTVADARIAGTIARDSEIFPAVLNADGSGSGLDADFLDGLDSGSFYPDHRGTQITGTDLPPTETKVWTTHSWPLDWHVLWTAVPTTTGGEVSLAVSVLLEANGLYTYRLTVTNVSNTTTNYSIRYAVMR